MYLYLPVGHLFVWLTERLPVTLVHLCTVEMIPGGLFIQSLFSFGI